MTHYSNAPGHVRADRFKPNGKWYDTWRLDMHKYYTSHPLDRAVYRAWLDAYKEATGKEYEGRERWLLVVLEPYHQNEVPVVLQLGPEWPTIPRTVT